MLENILVGVVIVLAAAYAGYRLFYRKDCGCGCDSGGCDSGGGSCDTKKSATDAKRDNDTPSPPPSDGNKGNSD